MGVSKVNKLKDLMHELCPNGVQYKKLADCCMLEKGNTPIQKAIPGEYPLVVTTEERKSCNTYQFDKPTVCIPLVSSRGHGVASLNRLYYQDGKFALGNILCGITPINSDELSAKFLFYYLNHKKDTLIVPLMRGGANVSLTVDSLKRVNVPIPPLPIQYEIVRIFDKFELLGSKLIMELTSRKKQYDYYRDEVFSLGNDIPKYTTADISLERFWLMPSTPKYIPIGIPYITSKNVRNGTVNFDDVKYISDEDYHEISRNRSIRQHDLLITMIGTIGEAAFVNEYTEFYGQNLYLVRVDESKCLRKYFYYYLTSPKVRNMLLAKKNPSNQGYLKAGSIDNLMIPIPSLEEQRRIVVILELFDKLCNDISAGIPAEIEARQKQYEYYQDKLLSFKEKE